MNDEELLKLVRMRRAAARSDFRLYDKEGARPNPLWASRYDEDVEFLLRLLDEARAPKPTHQMENPEGCCSCGRCAGVRGMRGIEGVEEGRRQMRAEAIAKARAQRGGAEWEVTDPSLSPEQRERARAWVDAVDGVVAALEAIPVRKEGT